MGKCQPADVSKLESLKITNFKANFSMPFQFPFSVISRAISLINLINFPLQTLWEHNAQPSGKIAALYRRKFIHFPPFFHNFLCRADEFLNNKKKEFVQSAIRSNAHFLYVADLARVQLVKVASPTCRSPESSFGNFSQIFA